MHLRPLGLSGLHIAPLEETLAAVAGLIGKRRCERGWRVVAAVDEVAARRKATPTLAAGDLAALDAASA